MCSRQEPKESTLCDLNDLSSLCMYMEGKSDRVVPSRKRVSTAEDDHGTTHNRTSRHPPRTPTPSLEPLN